MPVKKGDKINHSKHRRMLARHSVLNDMLNGATRSIAIDKLQNDGYSLGYNFSYETAKDIYEEAMRQIKKDFEAERSWIKDSLLSKWMDIYTDARERVDLTNANKALDYIAKMTGAYEPEKAEISIKQIDIDFGLE